MSYLEYISEYVQMGKADLVQKQIGEALEAGVKAADILNDGLLDGMGKLGVRFKNNEVYVPEVLIAARALNKGIELLKPHLIEAGVKPIGKVVLATVKGDLHDIGKNLVKMMLVGSGFEVIDLGTDVPTRRSWTLCGNTNPISWRFPRCLQRRWRRKATSSKRSKTQVCANPSR